MHTIRVTILLLAVTAMLCLASTATPATAANKVCAPLTGHTWHAGGKSGSVLTKLRANPTYASDEETGTGLS
jgi:hypothetical protein